MSRFIPILFFGLVSAACSSAHKAADMDASRESVMAMPGAQPRQVIQSATQKVEVKDLSRANGSVNQITEQAGGFVEEANIAESKSARYELRVPSSALNKVLDDLAALGVEEARTVSQQDVTAESVDLEAQLKNAKALRDRLHELVKRANAVKDIIEIEGQLRQVQTEIDSLEGRLKVLKSQVALSRISTTFEKKRQLGPIGYVVYGVGWALEKLFFWN